MIFTTGHRFESNLVELLKGGGGGGGGGGGEERKKMSEYVYI